jgi:hypothetical protein
MDDVSQTSPEERYRPTEHTVQLLGIFRSLLRAANEALSDTDIDLKPLAPRVCVALFWRQLQLGQSIYALIANGYAREAKLPARAMLNASISVIYILQKQTDTRAFWFLSHLESIEGKRMAAAKKHSIDPPEQIDRVWKDRLKYWDSLRAQASSLGLPAPTAPGPRTWSRLSDREMAEAVDAEEWYDLYYGPISDEMHVNAAATVEILHNIENGIVTEVGPQHGDLDARVALLIAAETVSETLLQIDKAWGLDMAQRVSTELTGMLAALGDHRQASGRTRAIDGLLARAAAESPESPAGEAGLADPAEDPA